MSDAGTVTRRRVDDGIGDETFLRGRVVWRVPGSGQRGGACQCCGLSPAGFMRARKWFNPKCGRMMACPGPSGPATLMGGGGVCGLGMVGDPGNSEARRVAQGFRVERLGQRRDRHARTP